MIRIPPLFSGSIRFDRGPVAMWRLPVRGNKMYSHMIYTLLSDSHIELEKRYRRCVVRDQGGPLTTPNTRDRGHDEPQCITSQG